MVLDELHELIETLQARIDQHAAALQQSEALTRYALIDPLLRALGWDTGDPSQVLVEYRSAAGSADYALLGADGQPAIIVEAKRLGTELQSAVSQGINYCIQQGTPHFALTDGQRWEVYETFRAVPLDEKRVVSLDLHGPTAETCLHALALWRPSASAGTMTPGASALIPVSVPVEEETESVSQTTQRDSTGVETEGGWHRLSRFSPQVGSKPSELRFPDGKIITMTNWGDFIAGVVEWLQVSGNLSDHDLPIQFGDQTQYVVSTTLPSRTGFDGSGVYRQVGEWHVRTNYTGGQHARNAKRIIERAGLDPADFAVKLQE